VSFIWVPAHDGIVGNERADFVARQATSGNMVYNALHNGLLEIYSKSRNIEWQKNWEVAATRRFSHSIFPRVSFRPWFEEWRMERNLITTVSRIISGHCGVRTNLKRSSIVDTRP
jgi:hypothetical protein